MAFAKHSNGRLFRFLTGSPRCTNEQYSVVLRAVTAGAIGRSRGVTCADGHSKKAAAAPRAAAAVFPQQKNTDSVLADPCAFPHLSSSPDLRLSSSVRPSQIAPMTGFRLAQNLHAYSGGTVRDFHPVSYSPVELLPHPQALKRNIYFPFIIHAHFHFVNRKLLLFLSDHVDAPLKGFPVNGTGSLSYQAALPVNKISGGQRIHTVGHCRIGVCIIEHREGISFL